jgi:WD40 repeat protein
VISVGVSPDARWMISGSKDRAVQFWDVNTATAHVMLQGHKNSSECRSPFESISRKLTIYPASHFDRGRWIRRFFKRFDGDG